MKHKLLSYLIPLALANGQASAAFYVKEESFHQRTTQIATDISSVMSYDIPFFIKRTQLGPHGRRAMQALLREAQKVELITIIGRTDAEPFPNQTVAKQRAFGIKKWLIDNGIPAYKIKLRHDSIIKPSSTKYVFNSEVLLLTRENSKQPTSEHLYASNIVNKLHKQYADAQPKAEVALIRQEQFDGPTKLAIASKILALCQNNFIQPEDVVKLLAELMQVKPTGALAPQQLLSEQALRTAITTPEEDKIRTWTLSSNKSLRANLEDWVSEADWNKLDWQPANPYQITFSSTLQGTLLQVLAQIAQAIPELDLQVSRRKREIRVIQGEQ